MRDHLIQREFFTLVWHRPTHPTQIIDQRLGQITHALIESNAGRVLALGQLALVGIAQQRHMAQLRHIPAEVLVKQYVLGRGVDPLLAAQHMSDTHQVIVHHVGQVIGRQTVRLHQHLHIHLLPGDVDLAAQHVLHLADAVGVNLHAHHVWLTRRHPLGHLLLAE